MNKFHELRQIQYRLESRARRFLYIAVCSVILVIATLVIMESMARVFWKLRYDVPFFRPSRMIYAFYPELWDIDWKGRDLESENPLKILLLGGSVLNRHWSNVEQILREQVSAISKRPVVVYNLAQIGHTSRDSYIKYQSLSNRRFDLVLFYHGINEARANNVPPDLFQSDYSHYSWYENVNNLQKHPHSQLVLPFTLEFIATQLKDIFGIVQYASLHAIRKDWLVHGQAIKSAASFESNLKAVIDLGQRRNAKVLLMTFATHLPANYSPAAFKERALDYTLHLSPVEYGGRPRTS